MPLVTVDALTVEYWTRRGKLRAVDEFLFSLGKAETLGVVENLDPGNLRLACL